MLAAEELRNQLSQTKKNTEVEKPDTAESRDMNLLTTFPWFYGILRKCRQAIGTKDANTFNSLLHAFVKELCVSIKDCYSRPNRAGKLRDLVSQMLVYFNMIDRGLKEECINNNNTYLHLMTELLAMYLDLEIKASKRSVDSLKKIGQFMTTALYTHLGESEDHIIEAILKAKLITKSSGELCAPVLSKVLNDGRCFIGDENAYVRFLLAFKLLQKITRRSDRRDITKMALRKLDPAPELVRIVRRMNNIFPPQKIMDEPITAFLMNAKFDFIKAKLEFLRTGSISKGSQCDIYPEKPFSYGSQSNSITNLLKQCRKDEQNSNLSAQDSWSNEKNKKNCSTDIDLDPSLYRLSLSRRDGSNSDSCGRSDDDSSEIEFLGTRNRTEKPVVLVTLDSDDENEDEREKKRLISEESVGCVTPSESEKNGDDGSRRQNKKDALTISGILDVKSSSYKEKTSKKVINVPESDGKPDSGEREETSSTKHAGGVLPSVLQSPEHGVIESTNNFIDSVLDESLRSPIRKTYDAHSNTDEGRTEVSSSLDFVDSTADLFNEDYFKAREPEITSTRDKSESFSSTGDDLSNLTNDLYSALNLDSHRKRWDTACADSPHGFLQNDFSENGNDVSRSFINSELEKRGVDTDYCSSTSRSNTQHSKSERMSIIQNYSQGRPIEKQRKEEPSERVKSASCQPGVIQRTCESNMQLGVTNDSKQIRPFPVDGRELDCQRLFSKQSVASKSRPVRKEVGKSAVGEVGTKNLPAVSNNVENLIGTQAQKVNYENVLKSYKIVKSKRLKVAELSGSSIGQSKDASGRNGSRAAKFIKIDKSGLIGNSLKVKEGVKFVSKSLDFRTSKADGVVSKTRREDRGSAKTVERESVGTRTRTSQCVPIIFKKIEETKKPITERKRKGCQRRVSDGKSSRSSQTGKRKQKSHNTNIIKTDINMKSTLKHINPSAIPQFAAEVAKDCKRKYPEAEPNPPKVKRVNNPGDVQDNIPVDIKLVIADKFLGLKNSDTFLGQGNETSVTPVICPGTVEYPPNYECTSYPPIPQADGTQEGSFNQFSIIYPTEQSLYCKKQDQPHEIQNSTVERSQRFFLSNTVEAPATERPDSNPFESDYQDIFPMMNCDAVKTTKAENEKDDVSNEEEITDLVEQQEGPSISEDRSIGYDNHDGASSLEVGMAFNNIWGSGKVTSSTPRDVIISEISVEELNDVDEELRDFVEPWEGPRDWCPDDDEFFLSALPDPQKLFSVEDFSHLEGTFPSTNLNFESLRPEDFANMNAFDDKCLYDIRGGRDLDVLESTFNENFFVLQEKFPDCDVLHGDEAHPDHYESCKKTPRMTSPESRSDDQSKPRFKKGRRSSSSSSSSSSCSSGRKEKAGSSLSEKPKTRERMRSKMSVLVEGNTGKVDKEKLRSDSVAYHTRSISQKGIPIEYALAPPKEVKNKKSKAE